MSENETENLNFVNNLTILPLSFPMKICFADMLSIRLLRTIFSEIWNQI